MRKIIDLINLGQDGSHPSILDFKEEALRLAVIDNLGTEQTLIIKIRGY
jgi:hypothetical protein